MEKHTKFQSEVKRTLLTLFFLTAETILCTRFLLRIPSDSKNVFFLGLSKERLLMVGGFGAIFFTLLLGFIFLTKTASIHNSCVDKRKWIRGFFFTAILFGFFSLLPDYRFGKRFAAYAVRLNPYFVWIALSSSTICLSLRKKLSIQESTLYLLSKETAFPVFVVLFVGIDLFMELSGLGKTTESALWNKNGVPLQSLQLVLCFIGYGIFSRIQNRIHFPKRIILFFTVWCGAAIIWSFAPLTPHFFAPGPYDPNYEFYPYSDAIAYDIPVYTALQGWGFNFRGILLKPVVTYTAFISRLIAGGNYNLSLLIQSAIYGVLPAILFLFGSAVGGTGCGLLSAIFSILKEWNALNSETLLTVNSRLIMSEFAMQIICAAFCYFVFRWLTEKGSVMPWAAASGGVSALGILTRYNFLAFLPAAFLLVLIANWTQRTQAKKAFKVFCFSFFIVVLPWMTRSMLISGRLFPEIYDTFQRTLLNRRYQMDSHEGKAIINTEDIIYKEREISETTNQTEESKIKTDSIKHSIIWSIFNHGLHNFRASFLTLPMQLQFDDLEHLYGNDPEMLWADDWNNDLSVKQWGFAFVWLLALSFSCAFLWKRFGIAGFSIPYFWLVYAFSIGVSRSSGGRYVVPVNWIPMLLLALFISLLFDPKKLPINMGEALTVTEDHKNELRKTRLIVLSFCMYFVSMVLFDLLLPKKEIKIQQETPFKVFEKLPELSSVDWDKVEKQIASNEMNFHSGLVIYPRFYYYRVGEHAQFGSFAWKEYSRLVFYGINRTEKGGEQMEYVLPHTELINDLPNGSEFTALSCTSPNGYQDVLALQTILPNGSELLYVRDPLQNFECPVPEPVCEGIENCH